MARGFIFASQLCRKYGMPLPRSGKKTDVPSHGGALATVLAHGGVKFMHIGCNWPSGCVKTPGLFWWEGPDGSRVLTFYSNTYGTCVPAWMPRWYSAQDPFISTSLAPTADWPYPDLARHPRHARQLRPAQGRPDQGAVRGRRRSAFPASRSAWARWMISWTPSSARSRRFPS